MAEIFIIQPFYLFIDDIKRQHTETVELLLPSSRANRVEGAAGHSGEDCTHWVWYLSTGVLVIAQVLQHLCTIPYRIHIMRRNICLPIYPK